MTAHRRASIFKSFRVQATLSFGLMAMALVVVLSVSLYRLIGAHIARDQGDALQALAKSVSTALAEGLHERLREIELLAASPEIVRAGENLQRATKTLNRVQTTRPQYSWIGLASTDGIVQASTGSLLIGKDVSARPWFKQAQQGPSVGDVHEAKLLAKLLPPTANGEPLRFVDFSAPVKEADGKTLGILGAHFTWEWVQGVVRNLRGDEARNRGVLVFVADKGGHLIHRPAGPEGLIEPRNLEALAETHGLVAWSDGGSYLTATSRIHPADARADLGWTIIVRQPEALALDAATIAGKTILKIGGVASIMAMLLAWIMAGTLSKPLRQIASAARQIRDGDLESRLPHIDGSSELIVLSDSLRDMTESLVHSQQALAQANATLEARVQERTEALEKANADLAVLARKDGLTGLFNRRGAEDRMAEECARHRRNQQALSLVMIDIDHFKRINDNFGHDIGDEALKAVAQCLAAQCRTSDFIARFGGEEFLLLLPETHSAGAVLLAEKLRQAVAALDVPEVGHVTISVGVAQSSDEGEHSLREVLKAADAALYCAKQNGRNRVATAEMAATAACSEPAAAI